MFTLNICLRQGKVNLAFLCCVTGFCMRFCSLQMFDFVICKICCNIAYMYELSLRLLTWLLLIAVGNKVSVKNQWTTRRYRICSMKLSRNILNYTLISWINIDFKKRNVSTKKISFRWYVIISLQRLAIRLKKLGNYFK